MKDTLLRFFPVPAMLHPRACGISIQDDCVTLVQRLLPSRQRDTLRVEVVRDAIEHGELKDPVALGKALSVLRQGSEFSHAIVSLPIDAGFLVRMELDPAVADLREAVLARIEEYVPVSPADLLVDVELVGVSAEGAKRVLVAAYPRAFAVAYEDALIAAGFVPVATEPAMYSLARVLAVHAPVRRSVLVVHIGRMRTHGVIAVAERPWLISTIGMGWQRIVDAVARGAQVSPEDARRSVFAHGFSQLYNRELFDLMVPAAAALRDEIAKIVRFWDSHKERAWGSAQSVSAIKITGTGAAIPGIERHMEVGLDVRMKAVSPWDEVAREADAVPWVERAESFGYVPAAGAYIRARARQW